MAPSPASAKPSATDWKLVFILLGAGLIGVAAMMPWGLELIPRLLGPEEAAKMDEHLPLPMPLIILLTLAQNSVLIGAAIYAGLTLGRKIGFGAPELEAWRAGTPRPGLARRLAIAGAIGLAVGFVLIGLDAFVLLPRTGVELAKWMAGIPLWKRLLGGIFYGGITEELLTRLFLLTVLAWAMGKVWKSSDGKPAPGAVWSAIVITGLIFAAGHMPMAFQVGEVTFWFVTRVVVLNTVAGVVFGWLYTRRGLEAAMVAHAATHIPLQLLAGAAVRLAEGGA